MPASKGYAAFDAQSPLAPYNFSRREPGPSEIVVEILYCGVCHSDLHTVRASGATRPIPSFPATRSSAASRPSAAL